MGFCTGSAISFQPTFSTGACRSLFQGHPQTLSWLTVGFMKILRSLLLLKKWQSCHLVSGPRNEGTANTLVKGESLSGCT